MSGGRGLALQLGSLVVGNGQLRNVRTKESVPVEGAHVTVQTAGQMDKRVTATRLVLTGPLAFGLRKKKDGRQLFVVVEGATGSFVTEVDPKKHKQALAFAAKVNEAGKHVAEPTNRVDVLDQLERLGKLRDSGVLTEDEFEAQKAAILPPRDTQSS